MELGRHGDHRRRQPGMAPHAVLGLVDIGNGLRQGAVIADGAGQNVGNARLLAGPDDAVFDPQGLQAGGNRSGLSDCIEDVQVVVMPHGLQFLGVDILAQPGPEIARLDIVGGQRVSGQQRMAESVFDQPLHGVPAVLVEGHGWTQHPDDVAMLTIMFKDGVQFVVGSGERGFPRAPGAEGELVGMGLGDLKPSAWIRMPSSPFSVRPATTISPFFRRRASRTSIRSPSTTRTASIRLSGASVQPWPGRRIYSGKFEVAWKPGGAMPSAGAGSSLAGGLPAHSGLLKSGGI